MTPWRSPTTFSYGLSASIYTRNVNNAYRAMRDLETGIVYVNAPTIGAEIQLPFGGTKINRERTSRGRNGGDRLLFGMEDALRRLFGSSATRANRCMRIWFEWNWVTQSSASAGLCYECSRIVSFDGNDSSA